jgi:predicted acylesterase/phospholipase RssA
MIGEPDKPVRAITFGGGGVNAFMQLGAVHAALVARAKAPHVVLGVSMGAINATAFADVMQAGSPTTPPANTPAAQFTDHQNREPIRVARFRRILDGYQRARDELLGALMPDTYQVDANRPLKALELPGFAKAERESVNEAVESRYGLMRLYNKLLELRLSVRVVTQVIRRLLAIRAAGAQRRWIVRWYAIFDEYRRIWLLLGQHLHVVAPLFWRPILRAFVPSKVRERGRDAGDLIFRSRPWQRVRSAIVLGSSYVILWIGWLSISLAGFYVPAAVATIAGAVLRIVWQWITVAGFDWHSAVAIMGGLSFDPLGLQLWVGLGCYALSFVVAAVWSTQAKGRWRSAFGVWIYLIKLLVLMVIGMGVAVGLFALARGVSPSQALMTIYPWLFGLGTGLLICWIGFAVTQRGKPGTYGQKLLQYYGLQDSLFSNNILRQLLVKFFDPGYYGAPNLDGIVEKAMKDDNTPQKRTANPAKIGDYASPGRTPCLHLGVAVADVQSGELTVLPDHTPLVDALLAATAVVPVFRGEILNDKLYVDGTNIANEPTRALTQFLAPVIETKARVLHIYSVVALPISKRALPGTQDHYLTLVDVCLRAAQLRKFRDATLERRLLELYAQVIPATEPVALEIPGRTPGSTQHILRTWITPIEPDAKPDLAGRLWNQTDPDARRVLVAEAVAEGCRATLKVMIGRSVADQGLGPGTHRCRAAVDAHIRLRTTAAGAPSAPDDIVALGVSDPKLGPGVPEVCAHCRLRSPTAKPEIPRLQSLEFAPSTGTLPVWPLEWEDEAKTIPGDDPHLVRPTTDPRDAYDRTTERSLQVLAERQIAAPKWPPQRNGVPGNQRPLINLLFSGGVFRGVYQLGVLNALNQANVVPDIIAGASVGSITAAMVARTFLIQRGPARDAMIARLAATYLVIDRLVLTDRFADFIRNFTLRAAATPFSVRDADEFFRRYDRSNALAFNADVRRVTAGLERLLYITPFQLLTLLRNFRERRIGDSRLLLSHAQNWLERMGVGLEVLGAEPLAALIQAYVLEGLASPVGFDAFLQNDGIYFLATTTNLREGRLEILGEQIDATSHPISLLEGLLASSAFPGVFRPRWAWEVKPGTSEDAQYCDGGVMDNLPFDAVAEFLFKSAQAHSTGGRPLLAARPTRNGQPVPHLLFAASLECVVPEMPHASVIPMQNNWPALRKRVKMLGYNKKIDIYDETQQDIRAIYQALLAKGVQPAITPLDLEVVTARPNWLCDTFAFHPMLGFRRWQQAESIAHGCASTLMTLARADEKYLAAWGINVGDLPSRELASSKDPYQPNSPNPVPKDHCWFRPGAVCPFSPKALDDSLEPETRRQLATIYERCGKRQTHLPPAERAGRRA